MAEPKIQRDKPRHETVMDVTEERLAQVYAQAFLGAANNTPNPGELVEEIQSLVTDVINEVPALDRLFRLSILSHEHREKIIERAFRGRASDLLINYLKVVSAHDRLVLLRSIAKQVAALYAKQQGRQDVEVTTVTELDTELQAELTAKLQKTLGIEPVMHWAVDPALIAGMVVRVGDRVYDGSVKTLFANSRKRMIRRALEAIEINPERFIN